MEKKMILVYLECENGHIKKVSLEALNAAEKIASKKGMAVGAVLFDSFECADEAAFYGAELLIKAEAGEYDPDTYDAYLKEIAEKYEVGIMVFGATKDGKEFAAKMAAHMKAPLLASIFDLSDDCAVRPVYGGSLMQIESIEDKSVITVRSGSFGKPEKDEGRKAEEAVFSGCSASLRQTVKETVKEVTEAVDLENAEIIVSGGRGMGSKENFALVEKLAEALGGVTGASRPAIDAGWTTKDHQVGQSGKTVAPKLYIACGISGSMQHVSGMSGSDFIMAINKDEDAPIFDMADCAIVGNCMEIIPLMIDEIKKYKK